ncbi:tRNA-modifying protein YgfZ, partial [Stenotrophomonas maltophilia]|uniref:CAF17-like 4Fe-4S cluster assembly/insertion protein YgfZ n=1 Tax=Stenotrophomonas maltophilia TaxID=40324 RepID=UPI0009C969B7
VQAQLLRGPHLALAFFQPRQLGLDRLNGYSVKKGCYPGQEIVARTHFLGKAKRAVQLLHTAAPAQAGDGVQQDGAA